MKRLIILFILLIFTSIGIAQTQPHITDVQTVETLAALKALKPSTSGTWAFTRGYSSNGDGGGGFWIYSASSTATANDGTVVTPNGYTTGRWLRDMSGTSELKIEWFGGSTSAIDNSVALKAAVIAANGKVVRLGPGTYAFTNEVLLEAPITGFNIRGVEGAWSIETASMLGTILDNNIATAGAAIIKSTITPHKNTALADLSFVGTSAADGMVGLSFQKSFTRVVLERLSFKSIGNAIRIGYGETLGTISGYYSDVSKISIDNCGNGIYANCLLNGTPLQKIRINGCTGTGIIVPNSSDVNINNSWFEACATAINVDNTYQTIINQCYFEDGSPPVNQKQLVWTDSAKCVFSNNNVRKSGTIVIDAELKRPDSSFSLINNAFKVHSANEVMFFTGVTSRIASGAAVVNANRAVSGVFESIGNSFEFATVATATWFYFDEFNTVGTTVAPLRKKLFALNTVNRSDAPEVFYSPAKYYTFTDDEWKIFLVGTTFVNDIPFELPTYGGAPATAAALFYPMGSSSFGERVVFASDSLRLTGTNGTVFQLRVDPAGTLTATSTLTTP